MAQQILQTMVMLSGNVDNTFGQIGNALIGLGSQIDVISQKLIGFGKDSVETFVEYDDAMRETQAVGSYTAQEMERLDQLNREIAQTSTYTNLQSANAMVLIAQAGKDVDDTYALLPSVLDLAMAGNLDLADSVDYLLSSLTAMNLGMEHAEVLTDQMAKTASLGMTDIDTLGESMMRLGSASGEFFESSEEILTILSVMSQFGHDQRGSQAGTWLRNFMLSLAAPAGSIDDIVDAMEQLGIAEEEIEEYAENHSNGIAAEAVNSLIEQGLQVYDEKGKLLPAIDIIKSLRDTVRGNAAYSDDLTEITAALNAAGGDIESFVQNTEGLSDNALYSVFSKIFGKRGITTAMNLISISDEEWDQTLAEIMNSEGFAESMAETMQGGLGGALRELEAAWTELETTAGETLAPRVESVADSLHDLVVDISNMDEDNLNTLVDGLVAVAAAGPGIMLVGGAFRLIGSLATPVGFTAAAVTTLAAGLAAVEEISRQDMVDNFGEMSLDTVTLSEYVQSLGDDFRAAYSEVNEFNAALEQSITDYTNASQTFSGDLLTAMLTSTTLTEEDKENLRTLGQQMHASLVDGITLSTAATMSYWEMLFGGEEAAYDPEYQDIINLTNESYQAMIATAEEISGGLRDALTSAFDDGQISQEEYAEIQNWMQAYNDAMAQAAADAKSEEDFVNMQMLLHKAQTASYEDVMSMAREIEDERASVLAEAEQAFLREYFKLQYRGASEEELAAAREQYDLHVEEQGARYDDILLKLWESSIQHSDLAGAYNELGALADRVLGGELTAESAVSLFKDIYGNNVYAGEGDLGSNNTRTQLGEYLARMISGYGGYEGLMDRAAYYEELGNAETAAYLRRLYAMQQINDDFAETGVLNYSGFIETLFGDSTIYSSAAGEYSLNQAHKDEFLSDIDSYIAEYSVEAARRTVEAFGGENGALDDFFNSLVRAMEANDGWLVENDLNKMEARELNAIIENLAAIYDFEKVLAEETSSLAEAGSGYREYIAAYSLMFGKASQNLEAYRISLPQNSGEGLSTEGAVTGLAESAQAELEAAQAILDTGVTAEGVVSGLYEDAISERSSAQSYLNNHPGTWRVNTVYGAGAVNRMAMYAEGGRATEASIFGEAGAEWAIPEEHTANTASLIWQAAQASGFTWGEIAEANGGSSGGSGGNTLIYTPTIIAADATGVEEKLKEDKERLEAWLRERELKEKIAVYA